MATQSTAGARPAFAKSVPGVQRIGGISELAKAVARIDCDVGAVEMFCPQVESSRAWQHSCMIAEATRIMGKTIIQSLIENRDRDLGIVGP